MNKENPAPCYELFEVAGDGVSLIVKKHTIVNALSGSGRPQNPRSMNHRVLSRSSHQAS